MENVTLNDYVSGGNTVVLNKKPYKFPKIIARSSPVGGYGVFACENIDRGTLITLYGGRLVSAKEAAALVESQEATHLKSIEVMHSAFDSRVQGKFTMDYYANNNMLGGLINSAVHPSLKEHSIYDCHEHPQPDGLPPVYVDRWIGFVAARHIEEGEELFWNYKVYM